MRTNRFQNQQQLAKAMKIKLGVIARRLREVQGISQKDAAKLLGISAVHLCNIENNNAEPSADLLDRYRQIWDVDLYVLAWCTLGDINSLPPPVRAAAAKLASAWKSQLGDLLEPAAKERRSAENTKRRASLN